MEKLRGNIRSRLITLVALIATGYISYQLYFYYEDLKKQFAETELRQKQEDAVNAGVSNLEGDEQLAKYCSLFETGMVEINGETQVINLVTLGEIEEIVRNGEVCYDLKFRQGLASCEEQATFVTHSCRAYDKSGFHGRPKARCSLRLYAGEGRFFRSGSFEVVSEYYRRLSTAPASSLTPNSEELTVSYSGSIGCTNSKGTGRTCEAKATVRAKSYPLSCSAFIEVEDSNP